MAVNKDGRLLTTAIIIEKDGLFLGASRKDDYNSWGFPGGKTEEGETTIQCVVRELQEETGLTPTSMNLVDVRNYEKKGDPVVLEEVWLYRIRSYRGELYTKEQLIEMGEGMLKWVTPEELSLGAFGDYNMEVLEKLYGLRFGYHLRHIRKGKFGEMSKVIEELEEYADAKEQGSRVMMLVELADAYGALREVKRLNPKINSALAEVTIEDGISRLGFTKEDLEIFADITERAFRNGYR